MSAEAERVAGVRWWPVAAIVAVGAAAQCWTWMRAAPTNSGRVIETAVTIGLGGILLVVWLLRYSRLTKRVRWSTLGAAVALGLVGLVLVELRGFTGDLVPVVAWRFAARAEPGAAARTTATAAGVEAGARAVLDFPQFFGSRRDGHVAGVKLARDWQAEPPRVLWRLPIGPGWAGFAIAGADAITLEQHGADEVIVCYDLGSGAERWRHAYTARHEEALGGLGPRSTPTLSGGQVYALGATGLLSALDRRTGELLWRRDTLADAGAAKPTYGTSGSPLVLGDKVVVTPGGTQGQALVAYAAADGERLWSGGNDRAGYSSPMLAQLAGVPQILVLNDGSLSSHDPASGRQLWSAPWSARQPNAAQPVVVSASDVVISSGYGIGAARFEITRAAGGELQAREVWKSRALKAKFAGFVHHEGHLYGLDDGILACIDAANGERVWKGGRYGHGQLLLVEDLLLVMAEQGEIVLVEATSAEHRELTRFAALADKTWNPPALAPPYLIVRNDLEAVCLELPLAEPLFSTGELER